MFILSTLEDNVRVEPQDLDKPPAAAITTQLEHSFVDRVVDGLGLVVTLYDVLSVGDGHVYPSDGGAHYRVSFRVVTFRPFRNEMLLGKVQRMTKDGGICVDLGFFKDVVIPPHGLPEPSDWDEQDEAWRWQMGDQDLYFELGLPLRFKVQSVRFNPVPTLATQQQQQQEGRAVEGTSERPYAPMEVVGRVDDDGLGMVHWYAAEAED